MWRGLLVGPLFKVQDMAPAEIRSEYLRNADHSRYYQFKELALCVQFLVICS
jgi:hypothetical protein